MKNKILILLGLTIFLAVTAVAANKKFTLVIDAGHGGHDAGAIGAITKEKTINLNVALTFGTLVERNCPDVKVVYTRKTDVFIPLHSRADIANRNKADLFVSIHTNALPKGRISRGIETYTLGMHRAADNLEVAKRENEVILYEKDYKQRYQGFDPNSSESYIMFEFMQDHNMAQSVELAKFVQRRICASAGRQNKGVKQAGFLVLRETSMPSCLIELGFISTPDEERFLHSGAGVSSLALGIYQAFLDYKRKYDTNVTVPLKAETKQEVDIPTIVPKDEVKDKKQEKKENKKRRKSKMAQELADAREGKDVPDAEVLAQQAAPNTDLILSAIPANPNQQEQQPAQPAQTVQQPVQPVQQPVQPVQQPAQTKQQPVQTVQQPVRPVSTSTTEGLVFKVQIMACDIKLQKNDPRLKGLQHVDFYQENGLYKYTVGSSANYNEIVTQRKNVSKDFPQAFIVAFKNGQKMNVQAAIQEYKANKK